jgi:hypothetical protein
MPLTFLRADVNHVDDALADNANSVDFPRNSFRRRDFKFILPRNGYYDRTGFNGPLTWNPSSIEHSLTAVAAGLTMSSLGFLPLGYVPSAGIFMPIADYDNIPTVYGHCQVLDSSNTFSGVDVSTTFPCRGLSALGSDAKNTQYAASADRYVDRGQLDPIIAVMHSIGEKRKYLIGASSVSALYDQYVGTFDYKDNAQSWANSATEFSGASPDSQKDYEEFSFSRGIHQLYKDYTKHFNRHNTRLNVLDTDGAHVLAHAFGSVFNSSKFDEYGRALSHFPNIVASSTESASALIPGQNLFDLGATATFASTFHVGVSSLAVSSRNYSSSAFGEMRNNTLISGVELIHTSGSSPFNSFTFYNIDKSFSKTDHPNFAIDNPMVKLRSVDGFPRIQYSTKGADVAVTAVVSVLKNFLVPDHKFRFDVKYSGGTNDGMKVGQVGMGVWVHTAIEGGYFWSLNKEGLWEYVNSDDLNRELLFERFIYTHRLKNKDRKTDPGSKNRRCLDETSDERNVILSFSEDDFETFSVWFNTKNKPICVPEHYYKNTNQIHRIDQDYVIEVFMLPSDQNIDKFALLDEVNLIDLTQNERTMIPVYGTSTGLPKDIDPLCEIRRIKLSKEEVYHIIRYFNKISGATFRRPDAGRDAFNTSAFMEFSGGSRLNYRQNYLWPNFYRQNETDNGGSHLQSNEILVIDI